MEFLLDGGPQMAYHFNGFNQRKSHSDLLYWNWLYSSFIIGLVFNFNVFLENDNR